MSTAKDFIMGRTNPIILAMRKLGLKPQTRAVVDSVNGKLRVTEYFFLKDLGTDRSGQHIQVSGHIDDWQPWTTHGKVKHHISVSKGYGREWVTLVTANGPDLDRILRWLNYAFQIMLPKLDGVPPKQATRQADHIRQWFVPESAKDFIKGLTPVRCRLSGPWDDDDRRLLYWSNADGWVNAEQATLFDLRELTDDSLPKGTSGVEILDANGDLISAGAPMIEYWKRRYIPGYAARNEGALEFIKKLGKRGPQLPDSAEYKMRAFVTGQDVRSVVVAYYPEGYTLTVILDGGVAESFGPFNEQQVRFYKNQWYAFSDARFIGNEIHEAKVPEPGKAKEFIKKFKRPYGEVPTAKPIRAALGRPVAVRARQEGEEQLRLKFHSPATFQQGAARKFIHQLTNERAKYRTGDFIDNGRRFRRLVGQHVNKGVYIWKFASDEKTAGRLGIPWRDARIVVVLSLSQGYGNPDKEWPIYQDWASFSVLKDSLRTWRNLYGSQLFINGVPAGKISYRNPHLL